MSNLQLNTANNDICYVIGIDPGKSGSIAVLELDSTIHSTFKLDATEHDIAEYLSPFKESSIGFIESVHSMPKQGVASSFTFGKSFGFLLGLLTGYQIPYRLVTPQKWQKALSCLSRGNKNITKAAAQRNWPRFKITHANADALLIAEYGRQYGN